MFNTAQLLVLRDVNVIKPYGCVMFIEDVPSAKITVESVLIIIFAPVETYPVASRIVAIRPGIDVVDM